MDVIKHLNDDDDDDNDDNDDDEIVYEQRLITMCEQIHLHM